MDPGPTPYAGMPTEARAAAVSSNTQTATRWLPVQPRW